MSEKILSASPIDRLGDALHAAFSELFAQPGFDKVYLVHFTDEYDNHDHEIYDSCERAKHSVEQRFPGPTVSSLHGNIPHNWDESNAHGLIWYWGPGRGKDVREDWIAYVEELTVKTATGPGSTSDKAKALLQLETRFATSPAATGYSHLAGLVLRDAELVKGAGEYVALARLVANLKYKDMRFLWDETTTLYRESNELSKTSLYDSESMVLLRKATALDRIREILVGIREVVTGETLSYPDAGGVEARKLR